MIKEKDLSTLLCFDLETAPEYRSYDELLAKNPRKACLWEKKYNKKIDNENAIWKKYTLRDSYSNFSPLYAEFGRIVCASFGFMEIKGNEIYPRIKSFYDNEGTDSSEKELILKPILELFLRLEKLNKYKRLCGHSIKKFDVPWVIKKMMIYFKQVPEHFQIWGKKPWEISFLDTGELWALGNWDGHISLDLLTCALGISSPKEMMSGDLVGQAFWEKSNYEEIKTYCEGDVLAVMKICYYCSNTKKIFIE